MRVTYKRLFLKKRYPLAISRGVITGSENLFVCVEAIGQTGVGELASTTTEQGENCDTGLAELEPFVASPTNATACWRASKALSCLTNRLNASILIICMPSH